MQSGLQAIVYLNLQTSTSTSASIPTASSLASYPIRLYYPDTPHNSQRAFAEVFASNQVKPKLTCSPLGLGATSLPIKRPLSFPVNALTFIEERQS